MLTLIQLKDSEHMLDRTLYHPVFDDELRSIILNKGKVEKFKNVVETKLHL